MTATHTASQLARKHGVTLAATFAAARVRRWASRCGEHPHAVSRMRFWLAVDWELHHNPRIPC